MPAGTECRVAYSSGTAPSFSVAMASGNMYRMTWNISYTGGTTSASSFGADVGVHYKLNPDGARPMNAAFVLRNFGTRPGGFAGGQSDPMPVSGTLAVSMEVLPKTPKLDVEGTKYRDAGAFFSAGGEYAVPLTENIGAALRSGYSTQRSAVDGFSGLTLGGLELPQRGL